MQLKISDATHGWLALANIPSFFAIFSYSSASHPATIPSKSKFNHSPFPARKARDAQGEHL
jgi:hypothetical protein